MCGRTVPHCASLIECPAFAMIFWGGYCMMKRCCKALVALKAISLAVGAFFSHADAGALGPALILPGPPADKAANSAVLPVMALIGTEAGSLTKLTKLVFAARQRLRQHPRLAWAAFRSFPEHYVNFHSRYAGSARRLSFATPAWH